MSRDPLCLCLCVFVSSACDVFHIVLTRLECVFVSKRSITTSSSLTREMIICALHCCRFVDPLRVLLCVSHISVRHERERVKSSRVHTEPDHNRPQQRSQFHPLGNGTVLLKSQPIRLSKPFSASLCGGSEWGGESFSAEERLFPDRNSLEIADGCAQIENRVQ